MNILPSCALLLALSFSFVIGDVEAGPENTLSMPYQRASLMTEEAQRAITIGLASAGDRLIAVGERGVILLSDDNGKSWRQVRSPVSVTLTAVEFVNEDFGWAVGHSGVVLHTRDGGETWKMQFDGVRAAKAIAARVEELTLDMNEEEAWSLQNYADILVEDGPDKPFLDVLFLNKEEGFIVGAFGLAFRTSDGGQTWQPWFDQLENPDMLHLYQLSSNGMDMAIVGERGLYLMSDGPEEGFEQYQVPYSGSFFTIAPLNSGEWLLAGLRGNVFIHSTSDDSYQKLSANSEISINGSLAVANDRVLLVDQAGNIYQAGGEDLSLNPIPMRSLPPSSSLISSGDGAFVAATFRGPIRFRVQAQSPELGEQQ